VQNVSSDFDGTESRHRSDGDIGQAGNVTLAVHLCGQIGDSVNVVLQVAQVAGQIQHVGQDDVVGVLQVAEPAGMQADAGLGRRETAVQIGNVAVVLGVGN